MKYPAGKRYTFSITGIIDYDGDLKVGDDDYVYSSTLELGDMEPAEDPLPTTPRSVIRDDDGEVYERTTSGRWITPGSDREFGDMIIVHPFALLFDAGAA